MPLTLPLPEDSLARLGFSFIFPGLGALLGGNLQWGPLTFRARQSSGHPQPQRPDRRPPLVLWGDYVRLKSEQETHTPQASGSARYLTLHEGPTPPALLLRELKIQSA